jgi:hypothetical protein
MPLLPSARGARAAAAVALVAAGGRRAAAQPADSARPAAAAAGWDVAPYVGYATRSPVRFWGLTPGRSHLMLGVQLVRPVARAGAFALAYAPNVVPVFVLTNNPASAAGAAGAPGGGAPSAACEATRCGPVGGAGVAPAGLRVEARPAPGLRLYGAAAAGLVLFARNVPVREARRLNATAEWGGGAAVRAAAGLWVQAGYKYHHLSNAYTAARNPGVDGRVVYGGVLWHLGGAGRR